MVTELEGPAVVPSEVEKDSGYYGYDGKIWKRTQFQLKEWEVFSLHIIRTPTNDFL